MSQIQKGETFADGQIVTYDRLNDLVDSAVLLPPVINGQTALSPLTGNEETLIYDPASLSLKKCLLKNALLTGNDISTGLISNAIGGVTINGWTEVRLDAPNIKLENYATVGSSIDLITHSSIQLSSSSGNINFSVPNGNITFTSTRSIRLPVGTTAQRPATPVAGDTRFNSTTSKLEFYNGTAWVSSITSSSGTSTYLLYEIYQEDISATGFVSTTFTKPVGEVWEFEVIFNWWSIINSSSSFATSELFSVSVVLDGSTKWYVSNPSIKATPPRYQTTAKWTEDSSTTYTSKTVSITGQSGSWGFSAPITSGTTSMIIKKYKVLS